MLSPVTDRGTVWTADRARRRPGHKQVGRFAARRAACYPGPGRVVRYGAEPVYILDQERKDDWWEVEALFDLTFAPGRGALSSYRLREGVAPVAELCRVARAEDGGYLGGAIRYWPVRVGGVEALLLGPVAVHPTAQGEGLGGALIRDSLERARTICPRVLLVGDAPYYRRFGFARIDGVVMPPPTNPDRVLATELVPGAWRGVTGAVTRAA